jgi:hypothetical protein
MPIDAGAHTAFPLLHMMLPEFASRSSAGGHQHRAAHAFAGDGYTPPTTQGMRDFIVTVGETTANECIEPRQLVRIVDATFENKMIGVSSWTVPEASGNFCARGGRFGTHSTNENMTPIYYGACCSWRTSTPACARSTSAIRSTRRRSRTSSRR